MRISVLGLGPSLREFSGDGVSIGVNDIWRYHPSEYVVCVDPPDRFSEDRRQVILSCKPTVFYTHLSAWASVHGYTKVDLQSPRGEVDWNKGGMAYGIFTPFCAMFQAVRLGATEIELYGIDFVSHPNLGVKVHKCIDHLINFQQSCPVPIRLCQSSELWQVGDNRLSVFR